MRKIRLKIFLIIIAISLFGCSLATHVEATINGIDSAIPNLPKEFQGLDLMESFAPAVGTGIKYSEKNDVLQLSNDKKQGGAIWGENKINLNTPFVVSAYLYLGDNEQYAADGMTFSLQQYGMKYLGQVGKGLGIYGADSVSRGILNDRYKFSLEFDTYFNGDGPDKYDGDGGYNGLTRVANHIAWAGSPMRWEKYQYHFGASQVESGDYFANGSWKKVTIKGNPLGNNQANLTYVFTDLKTNKTYSNSAQVDYSPGVDPYNIESHPPHVFNGPEVYWGFTSSTGKEMELSAISFDSLPQKPAIAVKDVTIIQNENWDASQNFLYGTDEASRKFQYEDNRLTQVNNVDTNIPGIYRVIYNYKNGNYSGTASSTVTVLEDKTSIHTKNSELYVGQFWDAKSNFVNATDETGNPIPWGDSRIIYNEKNVDTTKVGINNIIYKLQGRVKEVDSTFTVNVKKDQTKLELNNVELFVGDIFDPDSPFKEVTDKDGKRLLASDITDYKIDGKSVKTIDTSVSGIHIIQISYINALGQNVSSNKAEVIVKRKPYNVEETLYNVDGEVLKESQKTALLGEQEFIPSPEKYFQKDGVVYSYKGWLVDEEVPGKIQAHSGMPPKAREEKSYYYIYEKSDKIINVTLPTELIFGTFQGNKNITSKNYEITNNATDVDVDVIMSEFSKDKSDITLLGENEQEPHTIEKSAKLNLLLNKKLVIKGLTEDVKDKKISNLPSKEMIKIGIDGRYFGDMKERHIITYQTKIKIKVVDNNEYK